METSVVKILRDYGYEEDIEVDSSISSKDTGSGNALSETYFESMLLVMKKDELKEEARKRHLPLNGNKIDLVLKFFREISAIVEYIIYVLKFLFKSSVTLGVSSYLNFMNYW